MSELTCTANVSNIAKNNCDVRYGFAYSILLDPNSDGLATTAAAMVEANWISKINDSPGDRTLVLRDIDNIEWENGETGFFETNTQKRFRLAAGVRRLKASFHNLPRCSVDALKALSGQTRYAYTVTSENYILGASEDMTKFQGSEALINVDNERQPNGAAELWAIDVYIDFRDPDGMNALAVKPTAFNPKQLDGIVDVEITKVSAATSSVVIDVNAACDGREVSGLVVADFVATGLASLTSVGNRYTLTPTTSFTLPLTVALANQPDMTTKGYELQTAAIIAA